MANNEEKGGLHYFFLDNAKIALINRVSYHNNWVFLC